MVIHVLLYHAAGDMMSEVDGINTNIFTNIWPQYPLHNQRMLSKVKVHITVYNLANRSLVRLGKLC